MLHFPTAKLDQLQRPHVSHHAVVRYCQRILGVWINDKFASEAESAEAHATAAGLTTDQVRHVIWCPAVVIAARLGAVGIVTDHFWAALNADGLVVTIAQISKRRSKPEAALWRANRQSRIAKGRPIPKRRNSTRIDYDE